ncbi:MAG: tRNA pseudouridine(54/55) synthase Pus10 [Candidatus Thermoplasmatota archaeon]
MADFSELLREASLSINREGLAEVEGVCRRCLGRAFAKVGRGLTNPARGAEVTTFLAYQVASDAACTVCRGIFLKMDTYVRLVLDAIAPWEHSTFLIGSRFDPVQLEAEERLWSLARTEHHEPIKAEFNRELGKAVGQLTGKSVDFERPDLTIVVDTVYETVDVQVASLFIKGRYRKTRRGIPQTRWPCKMCRGAGCPHCGGKGKMYETSVEEIIAARLMPLTMASAHAFHGMGREDIDARMLGTGRPFIIEMKEPHRRSIDLAGVERQINGSGEGVDVSMLMLTTSSEVRRIKEARSDKVYRVLVALEPKVSEEKLKEGVNTLHGSRIVQQTPRRVAHRRADMSRHRMIRGMVVERYDDEGVTLLITAEAGTYIKEMITGDDGRTHPSLSEALGVRCTVRSLDVISVAEAPRCEAW